MLFSLLAVFVFFDVLTSVRFVPVRVPRSTCYSALYTDIHLCVTRQRALHYSSATHVIACPPVCFDNVYGITLPQRPA